MSTSTALLFAFLRDMIYTPASASLDIEEVDDAYKELAQGLAFLFNQLQEVRGYAKALSAGDLSTEVPPSSNELAAPLKSLHASLKHMTWQSQQVARGDYNQRVDFMGEFSDAFNAMTAQLDARQSALEQSNILLSKIAYGMPQPIFVISDEDHCVCFRNEAAGGLMRNDESIIAYLADSIQQKPGSGEEAAKSLEIVISLDGTERFFLVESYPVKWGDVDASAIVLIDISDGKKQVEALEQVASQDAMTKLFNRRYGMNRFHALVHEKASFSLCFVDLDNLKYVNDIHGHAEGDRYIITVCETLQRFFPEETIIARIGGDEFMILAENENAARTQETMEEIRAAIGVKTAHTHSDVHYSLSYGIIEIDATNTLNAGTLLGMADERMYEYKKKHKISRT